MEILSVNGFIECSANISGSIRGLFCIVFLLLPVSFCIRWKSVWQRSFDMTGWSFWRGCCCPLHYPPKSTAVSWKQEALELGRIFSSSTQMVLSKKNEVHLKDFVFHSGFQKGIQRRHEIQKDLKRNEKNLNPPEGFLKEFEVSTNRKEDKRKKSKKIGFYRWSQKEEKRKNETEKKKKGFKYIILYFRGIVSLRKRINDFSQRQQLHKSQMPLLALSRGKTTDKEKKRTLLEILSRRRKKDREWLFIKRKRKKKEHF